MTDTVIVTDQGFRPDDWTAGFVAEAELAEHRDRKPLGVDVQPDSDLTGLRGALGEVDLIRIAFPAFSDGRGFTLARTLRRSGFEGRLRAAGHVLADQYTMVRRSGFDEVEINGDLAARQPQDQWRFRADWQTGDYQSKLRA